MTISAVRLLLAFAVLPLATAADDGGVLAAYPLDAAHMVQWRLPERLQEISGLALTDDGRLFAVADEKAVIFELDVENRRLVKAFALGRPVERGDFEGIAVVGTDIFVITSDGDLYRTQEGYDGERVDFTRMRTGLKKRCEIEGLAADVARERLLIACKQARDGIKSLPIFVWSLADEALLESATLELPLAQIAALVRDRRVNPSGIAVDAASGNLLLVAARQRALIELTAGGALVSALRLPLGHRHRQPEGIEIMRDGRLLLADEGGNHKARLAVYQRATQPGEQNK